MQPAILSPPAALPPFVSLHPDKPPDFCRPTTISFAQFYTNMNPDKESMINKLDNKPPAEYF
jgi:hypothetical protein